MELLFPLLMRSTNSRPATSTSGSRITMASASSSKKVAAPKMPQSRLFESGHMSYAVKGADLVLDESWVSLDTVAGQVALFLVISLTMLTPRV